MLEDFDKGHSCSTLEEHSDVLPSEHVLPTIVGRRHGTILERRSEQTSAKELHKSH